jgi:hypothetical protein
VNLVCLTDAQLKTRIADLTEEMCEETGRYRVDLSRRLSEAEAELITRKQNRLHDVFTGHFAPLVRDDLAFDRGDGDEWADIGDGTVVLVDDTRSDSTDLVQCARGDYDYCVDEGAGWRWWPLSFGPLQEPTNA